MESKYEKPGLSVTEYKISGITAGKITKTDNKIEKILPDGTTETILFGSKGEETKITTTKDNQVITEYPDGKKEITSWTKDGKKVTEVLK